MRLGPGREEVPIQAGHLRPGKEASDFLLQLLGAGPEIAHEETTTTRTALRRNLLAATSMADEPPLESMQDKGNAASGAFELKAAIPTQKVAKISPPVDQEDYLLGCNQALPDCFLQSRGEKESFGLVSRLFSHIHQRDIRQVLISSISHRQEMILSLLGLIEALDGRSAGGQEKRDV
jgi:hypothetical protein